MKRESHLMQKIADLENLYWAYWKAKRGKSSDKSVVHFSQNLSGNLRQLKSDLEEGSLSLGNYRYFTVYDPKERCICAAPFRERVIHHAIMNICHASFEKYQTIDSFATRQGKGTLASIQQAMKMQRRYTYFLKIDCRKYFDRIDHNILKQQLWRRFKDLALLELLFKIIDSYEVTPEKGLPIGNLTSQYFANHYLATADHYVKETLKIPAMIRYMDDIILWHNDQVVLKQAGNLFETFCEETLAITFKHKYLNTTAHGVSFLGCYLYKDHFTLNRRSKLRISQKVHQTMADFERGKLSEYQTGIKLQSLMVRPCQSKSYHFRKHLLWNSNEGKEAAWRQQLEQAHQLPFPQSQQQPPGQSQQQHRFSAFVFPQLKHKQMDEPFVDPFYSAEQ